MVAELGGPGDFVETPEKYLAAAPVIKPIIADGYLSAMDTFAIGNAIIELGGGRRKVGETLDMSVGFSDIATVGTRLDQDTPLAVVHAANEADAERVAALVIDACTLSEEAPASRPVVVERMTAIS